MRISCALLSFVAAATAAGSHPALVETMPAAGSHFPWPFADVASVPWHIDLGRAAAAGHPPPPAPPPAIAFATSHSDLMVLQQSPAVAAVFGTLPNASTGTVTLTVSDEGAQYAVGATVTKVAGEASTWKALLKPAATGGSYAITASVQFNATDALTASITNVTFGDVWCVVFHAHPV